jgi:hypothetical protein
MGEVEIHSAILDCLNKLSSPEGVWEKERKLVGKISKLYQEIFQFKECDIFN